MDEAAKIVGAVNTVKILEGKTVGFNTDVFGFRQMIKPYLKSNHQRAIILGTGGASKAVQYVLSELDISVLLVSRAPKDEYTFGYADINEHMINGCGLVINCTPVGMYPRIDECLEIPFQFANSEHLFIDLIYNPEETLFLRKAKEQGATILNGKVMLQQQAEKSWQIWND